MLKRAIKLLVLLLLFSMGETQAGSLPAFNMRFIQTNNDQSYITHNDDTQFSVALIDAIDSAVTELHIMIHTTDDQRFVDAILRAWNDRSVDVKIVCDGDNAREHRYEPFMTQLESAGIPMVCRYDSSAIMHNKVVVIDRRCVVMGTGNFTLSGIGDSFNGWGFLCDPRVAELYIEEFDQMFVDRLFGRYKRTVEGVFEYSGGETVKVGFSPSHEAPTGGGAIICDSSLQAEIIDALQNAQYEFNMGIFWFTQDCLTPHFIEAHERMIANGGRGLRITWDATAAASVYSEDNPIRDALGRETIMVETLHGKQHFKGAVDPYALWVWLGSCNLTRACHEKNDENWIIVTGSEPLTEQVNTFLSDYYDLFEEQIHGREYLGMGETGPACFDGRDNDYDSKVDRDDDNCKEVTYAECTDSIDNDGDGYIDLIWDGGRFVGDYDCWFILFVADSYRGLSFGMLPNLWGTFHWGTVQISWIGGSANGTTVRIETLDGEEIMPAMFTWGDTIILEDTDIEKHLPFDVLLNDERFIVYDFSKNIKPYKPTYPYMPTPDTTPDPNVPQPTPVLNTPVPQEPQIQDNLGTMEPLVPPFSTPEPTPTLVIPDIP